MTYWIINYIAVFSLCVLFAGFLIPQILLISFRRNLYDEPDSRKIHQGTVPRLGGIAFKPVVFLSIALLLGISIITGHNQMLEEFESDACTLAFGFCTIMILYLVGMADDLIGIKYRAKFMFQIVCGILIVCGGLWINNGHGVLGLYEVPAWFGMPLTVLIVLFIINAINLIDGIDGLASGLSSIALAFYGVAFFMMEEYIYALISFAVLGVLVPFFYYNVFGNAEKHHKIFMGDTGSLTVGMMLSFLSIKMALSATDEHLPATPNPLVMAFIPLFTPCMDVVRVYFHRIRHGRNPFLPDKNHLHHKLLAMGMSQRWAMVTILLVSTGMTLINIVVSSHINVNLLVIIDVFLWTVANILLSRAIARRNAARRAAGLPIEFDNDEPVTLPKNNSGGQPTLNPQKSPK